MYIILMLICICSFIHYIYFDVLYIFCIMFYLVNKIDKFHKVFIYILEK